MLDREPDPPRLKRPERRRRKESPMDVSTVGLASAWANAQASATRQALEIAMLRQQAEADRGVVALLEAGVNGATAAPPPPEGQGRVVDRRV
jgi:hypothetical protein